MSQWLTSQLFVRVGYVIEKTSQWIKLYVHARKELFVFVIHPSKENRAGNKENRIMRWRGKLTQAEEEQDSYTTQEKRLRIFYSFKRKEKSQRLRTHNSVEWWKIEKWIPAEKDKKNKMGDTTHVDWNNILVSRNDHLILDKELQTQYPLYNFYTLSMNLNCIWWWGGSSSGDLGNVKYPFFDVTPSSTLIRSGSTSESPTYGSKFIHIRWDCAKNVIP